MSPMSPVELVRELRAILMSDAIRTKLQALAADEWLETCNTTDSDNEPLDVHYLWDADDAEDTEDDTSPTAEQHDGMPNTLGDDPALLAIELRRICRWKILHTRNALAAFIRGSVMPRMPVPVVLTAEDILECAADTLIAMEANERDAMYDRFVVACITRSRLPISFRAATDEALTTWSDIGIDSVGDRDNLWIMMSVHDRFRDLIRFRTTFRASFTLHNHSRVAGLLVTSESSQGAHLAGVSEITSVVKSACRTLSAPPVRKVLYALGESSRRASSLDGESPASAAGRGEESCASMDPNDHAAHYLLSQIDLVYDRTDHKHRSDIMNDARLRNAVMLLAEADRQSTSAISVALSMSAIEALLCQKSDGISDQISRNSAAFLIPNADDRATAIRRVKKLYDRRSKTLHGVDLGVAGEVRAPARDLAAAVLFGVLEWCEARDRIEKEVGQSMDFFEQLNDAVVSGKRMVGNSAEHLRAAIDQLPI